MRKHIWNHGLWSLFIGGLLGCAFSAPADAADWCWWGDGNGNGRQREARRDRPYDPTPGVRQTWWKGRRWPAQPRPVTDKARAVDQFHYAHYWPFPNNCI